METLYHQIKFRQGDVHQICNRPYRRVWLSRTVIPVAAWFVLSLALPSLAFAQGTPEIVWQADNASKAIAFSPDGKMLLSGNQLRQVSDGTVIRTFTLPRTGQGINTVAISPDAQFAAIGVQSFNQNLDLFRVADGSLVAGPISAHDNGTGSVAFSPDGQLLASAGKGGAKLWHVPDMTLIRTIPRPSGCDGVAVVAFSRDGQLLAAGGCGVQFFRVSDGTLVRTLNGSADASRSVAFSPDGQNIAAGSAFTDASGQCVDCTIKLWRLFDGTLLQTIDGNNNGINSIAFAPDGRFIADGSSARSYNGVVRFWRLSDGMLVRYFNQDPNNVYSFINNVAYSPNGSLFAYARGDFRVVVARNPLSATPSLACINQLRSLIAQRLGLMR